jgi:hypothetical protein
VIGAYVPDKHASRLQAVDQQLRLYCRQHGGLVWLSTRTLINERMFRGTTETLGLVRELVAGGHIGRATARGRGRGKGRTLYWLPSTKKWLVLQELRREDMPHSAIVQALGFYARRERLASAENATDGSRQRSLGLSTVGTEHQKGSPAAPARRSRAPSVPPRQASRRVSHAGSTPPSTRRLVKHGSALERLQSDQLETALERMRAAMRRGEIERRQHDQDRMDAHSAALRVVADPEETTASP